MRMTEKRKKIIKSALEFYARQKESSIHRREGSLEHWEREIESRGFERFLCEYAQETAEQHETRVAELIAYNKRDAEIVSEIEKMLNAL